jgi:hypothetical protein
MSNFSISPKAQVISIDGRPAYPVDTSSIPLNVHAVQWDDLRGQGFVEYVKDPTTGIIPDPEEITDPSPYQPIVDEGTAILEASDNPVTYYFTKEVILPVTPTQSTLYKVGDAYVSSSVGHPSPDPENTTTLVPPMKRSAVVPPRLMYFYEGAWVVSSFPPGSSLDVAKDKLISQVEGQGALAVDEQLSTYSSLQKSEAPSLGALDTRDYPGVTVADFQSYVDTVVADGVSTVNAASSTTDLYSFDPKALPYAPRTAGYIFTGRGSGLGPLDMNVSYFTTWDSTTVEESDTELYAPATDMVMPYGSGGEGKFDSMGDAFTEGNYTVQIRQASTGFVLAQYECPLSPDGEDVPFAT